MAITASITASRLNGIAPLYVFFDASATISDATSFPFHEINYTWNFNDTTSGTWTYGALPNQSKNIAYGPVAAHVFETAGTYNVQLIARDSTGSADVQTVTITVTNWVEGVTGETLCVSNSASTADDLPGSTHFTSSSFNTTITSNISSFRRILFKRGDAFTTTASAAITQQGPGIIGTYGPSPTKPLITGTHGSHVLAFGSSGSQNLSDWRVMDLSIDRTGGGRNARVFRGMGEFNQMLILRCDIVNSGVILMFDTGNLDDANRGANNENHQIWDQLALVDCQGDDSQDDAFIYTQARRFAVMGNRLEDIGLGGGHITRYPYIGKGVIQNNQMSRPDPTDGLSVMKLHGPAWHQLIGNITNGSNTISNLRNETGTAITGGDYFAAHISGTGIPSGTYHTGGSVGSMTMSQAATQTLTGVSITVATASSRGSQGYSEQIVISNNQFTGPTGGNSFVVAIAPQSENVGSGHDDRIRNVIVERNLFITSAGASSISQLVCQCDFITVRNNIIIGSGSGSITGIRVGGSGTSPDNHDAWVYNNTVYTATNNTYIMVDISSGSQPTTNTTVRNNLGYAPSSGSRTAIAGTPTVQSNNSSTAQLGTNPNFVSATPSQPEDFKLQNNSYAFTTPGAFIPNFLDILGKHRSQTMTLGATEKTKENYTWGTTYDNTE